MISLSNTKITLKQIEQSNKGLFAAKTLSPWETILESKPLFSSVLGALRNQVCSNCMIMGGVSRW